MPRLLSAFKTVQRGTPIPVAVESGSQTDGVCSSLYRGPPQPVHVCVPLKKISASRRRITALGLPSPERMDHKRDEPNLSYRNGISQVLLYGEFTTKASRKVRYALSLTDRDLTVQKITSAPAGRSKVVFNLRDCVGSRAVKADDNTDAGAYFTAYFYPFKKRWMSSGVARQRTEQCFRVASSLDPHVNLEEAQRWARAISEGSALQRPQRNGECSTSFMGCKDITPIQGYMHPLCRLV